MRRSIFLLLAAAVLADPLRTPGEQVLHDLKEALRKSDTRRAVRLLREVGGIYRFPASAAEAEALLQAAGEATRSKQPAIVRAALAAVGATGSVRGVVYLKPWLRLRAGEEPQVLAAVQASGHLLDPTLIPPLFDLAKTGNDITVAGQALVTLGRYRAAPTDVRRRVVERVLLLAQATSRNRRRWRRLHAPVLRALQRLIHRRLNSLQQFQDWWRAVKAGKDPFR